MCRVFSKVDAIVESYHSLAVLEDGLMRVDCPFEPTGAGEQVVGKVDDEVAVSVLCGLAQALPIPLSLLIEDYSAFDNRNECLMEQQVTIYNDS
jgi:hypothetical protein